MDAIEQSVARLQDRTQHTSKRFVAVVYLGTSGDQRALKPLIDMLSDSDATLRATAAGILHRLGHHDAIPALQRALDDYYPRVRVNALISLVRLHYPHALSMVQNALLNDTEPTVRSTAIQLLAEIHIAQPTSEAGQSAFGLLVGLLGNTGWLDETQGLKLCDCAAEALEERVGSAQALAVVAQWRASQA